MNKDKIDKLFDDLKDGFDVEEPNSGHSKRFLDKLNAQKTSKVSKVSKRIQLWKPMAGIAATLLLVLTLVLANKPQNKVRDLASVSPEMEKTQSFFTSTISEELKKLESKSNPETKVLINDALIQIKKLEINYENLKIDLTKSGDDSRVIFAMIKNFQNRIDILQNTLEHIENIKNLNRISNESNSNI
ncbi:hypothetical protein OS188_10155 [Xanthomarina sp. F1114]|uniref:hypothetical protein n=1 Tax=Xanthomarina sp. F1114 TaxID=2996019 RepID=UPI00225E50E0|nr:hypothetical protein [Xanthomarina sp. F1114]MCX7548313.1 hypothetical protein [Xanthomarina sp. F1114]